MTVASSNIYIHRDEITGKNDGDILRSEAQLENKYATPWDETPWRIWVQTARDDKDLESIIQEWFGDWKEFGDGCKLGAKRLGSIAGVYNVGVDSVREDPQGENGPDGSCWINWRIGFKYSPSYKRAAIWDLGQEDRFSGHDTDIAKSFAFM